MSRALLRAFALTVSLAACVFPARDAAPPPPAPPACVDDPTADLLARAERRIARIPRGITKPALEVRPARGPVDLDLDGELDLALTIDGLHGPHSIAPGAWSLYRVRPGCTTFAGEVDGRFSMIVSDVHAGLVDLESIANEECRIPGGIVRYRWRFDGAQYRVADQQRCDCNDPTLCEL